MKRTIILSVLMAIFILTIAGCGKTEEIKGTPEEIYDAIFKNGVGKNYIYTVTGMVNQVEKDRVYTGNLMLYPDDKVISRMTPGDTITFSGKAVGINNVTRKSGDLLEMTIFAEIK